MKSTDLEKFNALKIQGRLKGAGTPARYAGDSSGTRAGAALNPLVAKLLKKVGDKPA